MKTLASLLGALTLAAMIAGCGPDMKTINAAGDKAEADATKAEASATVGRAVGRISLMRLRSRPKKQLPVLKMRCGAPMTQYRVSRRPSRLRSRSKLFVASLKWAGGAILPL